MAGPGISIQELVTKFQLSQALLDKELSEEHLREASGIIDDHETVGLEQGLSRPERTTSSLEPEFQMLTRWKKYVGKATYRKLIEALLKCSKTDQAQEVCKLLARSESFGTVYFIMQLLLSLWITGVHPEQQSCGTANTAAFATPCLTDHDVTGTGGTENGGISYFHNIFSVNLLCDHHIWCNDIYSSVI